MTPSFESLKNKLRSIQKSWRTSFFQILMVLVALIFIGVPILEFFRTSIPNPQTTVDPAETLYSLGLEAYQQGDLAGSIDYFSRAAEFDKDNPDIYYYLGRAYYDNGSLELAHTALSLAIGLDPALKSALIYRALTAAQLPDSKDVLQDISRVLELGLDSAQEKYQIGVAYAFLGEDDKALALLHQAVELDPALLEAYRTRAAIYFRTGDLNRSIDDYSWIVESDPGDVEARFQRGVAYFDLGSLEEAIEDWSVVIEGQPENSDALFNRGIAYNQLEEYEKVIDDLTRYLAVVDDSSPALNNRGLAHLSLGNLEEARIDFEKVVELDPDAPEAHFNLGNI
ncbi:MAG: tetratricopeptide repeat protein, partial [Anaerolineales bacterium]|nr:tetratricopeptide repeat protein [Anaerolineales bacterium]